MYTARMLKQLCRPYLQDMQLPPAFALPKTEAISRAIELAYERDFSYIPYVISSSAVLSNTHPLAPI